LGCINKTKHPNNNKERRLEWAGHVERMSDDKIVKKIFLGERDWKGKHEDRNKSG